MYQTNTNSDLKIYAQMHNVRLWQVADAFGIADANFSRKLRRPFSEADREKFVKAVDTIAAAREGATS